MIRVFVAVAFMVAAASADELKEAIDALEQQDYSQAAELLEKVAAEDPENVEVRFNLAFAYSELKQNAKAIEHYQKVVDIKPALVSARMNLGILLIGEDRVAEAAPHFQIVAAARPEDFPPLFYYAHALLDSGDPKSAIEPFERAVGLNPGSAEAALGLGQSLARTGHLVDAAPHYQKAAELDPQLSEFTLQLAELLEKSEDIEKNKHMEQALSIYQGYLETHPDAVAVEERVGMLLMERESYAEAAEIFEAAVERQPSAANLAMLAEVYSLNDQPEKALHIWQRAASASPSSAELRLRYANGLLHAERFEDAARNYFVAVEQNATLQEAWNGLAFSLYKVENFAGALKALRQSAQTAPPKPAQVYLQAITPDKLRMYEEAQSSYKAFLSMTPGMSDEEWKSKERLKVIEKVLRKR